MSLLKALKFKFNRKNTETYTLFYGCPLIVSLIRASVALGALSSPGIDHDIFHRLDHYARCIGLAFQIRDDILDIESDTATLGKTQGADIARDKPTYPSLLGMAEAKQRAHHLYQEALDCLTPLDARADPLHEIAAYIVERIN